jgi:hypothetical protein
LGRVVTGTRVRGGGKFDLALPSPLASGVRSELELSPAGRAEAAALQSAFASCSVRHSQSSIWGEEEVMHRKIFAAVCAAVFLTLGVIASGAFGGEVHGPPATTQNTDTTAAPSHANSACAFSGLNDNDPTAGQTTKQTQTPADGPPGASGHGLPGTPFENGCRGGYNPDNQPPPGNSGQH